MSANRLIALVAVFILLTGNYSFFSNVLKDYPLAATPWLPLASVPVIFGAAGALFLGLFCVGRATKVLLMLVLVCAAAAAYFMDSYNTVISDEMLQNVVKTDVAEARDLLSWRLLGYLVFMGALPAWLVSRVQLERKGFVAGLKARAKLLGIALLLVIVPVVVQGSFFASFLREHKSLRSYANPTYFLYSTVRFASNMVRSSTPREVEKVGLDARQQSHSGQAGRRRLVVMVVGETARADRFSLNGYQRETTPELQRAGVINYPNFWACGTSTAISVPCMFSLGGQANFSMSNVGFQEGAVDVLKRAGVNVFWMDNNSDSKGVALRVPYESYKSEKTNPKCDEECRDVGMIPPMQDFIDAHPQGDILIILHQMGNHGPAYFKRYPKEFEVFTPACQSNDLSKCSNEEISNAYDNAIRYTDHFLGSVITQLKKNRDKFAPAMFYLSDHGESLGENGLYLHGLPYALAPDEQKHVPATLWLGEQFPGIDAKAVRSRANERFTHDAVFHTLLGLFHVQTAVYDPKLDLVNAP